MLKLKMFAFLALATAYGANAQDLSSAKKAIDAEKYEDAKKMLKAIVASKPSNGHAQFLLGNVYLQQHVLDSAAICFDKGVLANDDANLNYIGIGQLKLEKGDVTAAKSNFDLAIKNIRKKDTEEFVYIGRAYMNVSKPDYPAAIEVLEKAKAINSLEPNVLVELGNAYYGDKKQNDAYANYRNALQVDASILRAEMQLGVILKGAKEFDGAIAAFNNVIAKNPNYGPVYRELAETYYKWGRNKPSRAQELFKIALGHYDKYMELTDYSLNSRMRHADFLVLAKDYKALEVEATKMAELDKVNPKIFRYQGYSAYENGNVDVAIKSLENFLSLSDVRFIGRDFLYLTQAYLKKNVIENADKTYSLDPAVFAKIQSLLKKAIEVEPAIVEEYGDIAKKLFSQKLFGEAAYVFEFGTTSKDMKNYLEDNVYCGLSYYYKNNNSKVVKKDVVELQKAITAFNNVVEINPNYADAYIYRARIQSVIPNPEAAAKDYEEYLNKIAAKGPEEAAKPAVKTKLIESHNTLASFYQVTDKAKTIEYLNKTIAIDPTNPFAINALKQLK